MMMEKEVIFDPSTPYEDPGDVLDNSIFDNVDDIKEYDRKNILEMFTTQGNSHSTKLSNLWLAKLRNLLTL